MATPLACRENQSCDHRLSVILGRVVKASWYISFATPCSKSIGMPLVRTQMGIFALRGGFLPCPYQLSAAQFLLNEYFSSTKFFQQDNFICYSLLSAAYTLLLNAQNSYPNYTCATQPRPRNKSPAHYPKSPILVITPFSVIINLFSITIKSYRYFFHQGRCYWRGLWGCGPQDFTEPHISA